MQSKIIITIDVERDLHSNEYLSIQKGLVKFEKICDKYNLKPTLFIVANTIKDNFKIYKRFHNKGWDLSLHGYSHKRFDDMSFEEKEKEINKSLKVFKKYLGIKPKGFRAPQHSIDDKTLDLLEKSGFEYDSSYIPLNFLQLLFFPKRFKLWFKTCFSPLNEYRIRSYLKEKPCSGIILPFVSLILRLFPKPFIWVYVKMIFLIYKEPTFYAHSWDFIKLKESRIDNVFPHTKFIKNLDYLLEILN